MKVSRSGQFRSLAEVAPEDGDVSASAAHGHFIRHLPKVVEAEDFRATPVNHDIKPADRLYIAVMSAPRNIARRTAVRTTWKKDADRKPHMFTVKFVVCIRGIEKGYYRRLQREIELYNDIEMLDCYEGYDGGNLTRKVFAAMQRFDEENEMRALAGNETQGGTYDGGGWCMYESANLEWLGLGCINADVCNQIFFRALGKIIREIPEKRYACMIHFDTAHPSGLISPIISAQETAFMKTDDDTLVRVGPLMEVAELSGR